MSTADLSVGRLIAARARAMDSAATVADVSTLDDRLRRTLAPQRFRATLAASLAGLAVLLALVGVYGVTAFGVARQAREQAIRLALGETRARARRRVVFDALRPAMLGSILGVAAAWSGGRFVESLLFQVNAGDPATLSAAPAAMVALAALAAWLPAARAARRDPTTALNADDQL
jgi:putative ABC transport system permease protein